MQTRTHVTARFFLALVGAILAGLLVLAARPTPAATAAPLFSPSEKGIVAADHLDASKAGAEVLRRGGNAMDAAAATALALGVVAPAGSGLGGGGFLVYWEKKTGRAFVLDFREVAPAAASRDMFVTDGKVVAERSRIGGLAIAVPAEPIGLATAEAKLGKAGLSLAVQPAERLAKKGFVATQHLAEVAAYMNDKLKTGLIRELIAPGGSPLRAGALVKRPLLGNTLGRIGKRGVGWLYDGDAANTIVKTVALAGGNLSAADLRAYRPLWREPLVGMFRGHTTYAMPAPGGGLTATEALQILDAQPPLGERGLGSSASHHAVAEALKHAFADRARLLGDPAFTNVPTETLGSRAYAAARAALVSDDKVQPLDRYGMPAPSGTADTPHDHGTSHLCVVDGEGNVAALTSTVNLGFGSGVIDPTTGILLNNQMDDFAAQPDAPNAFGLVGGSANAVAPGKRPLSSMTPMIVTKDGQPVLCVGGSGGPKIVTATVQTIVNVIDHQQQVAAAVALPRIHAQWMPDKLFVEPEIPADVRDALTRRGHVVVPMKDPASVQAIAITPTGLFATSDPRKGGSPAAP